MRCADGAIRGSSNEQSLAEKYFSNNWFLKKIAICDKNIFRRGSLLSTTIFVYAATSPVNGYFGGSLYARMGGKVWIRQMFVSAFMLPALVCGTAFCINFIAIYYHASRAIPFGTMVGKYL